MWPDTPGQQGIFLQNSAIFWLSGFSSLLQGVLYRFTRVCASKPFNVQELVRIFNKYKITGVIFPPYIVLSLLQIENLKPFESIKWVMIGGANVSSKLCERIKPFIPNGIIRTGYGCTEETFTSVNCSNKKYESSGFAFYNNEIKVRTRGVVGSKFPKNI
jgi:long-subunit acyl-CoA synthetase (AMP-forming)